MELTDKYYKMYIRFLKEESINFYLSEKEYHKNSYDEVISEKLLPHMYDFETLSSKKSYIYTILDEYVKDIILILEKRLNLVNYENFKIMNKSFDNKESFIEWIISSGYVFSGLRNMDNYIVNVKHVKLEKSSFICIVDYFFKK